MGLASFWSNLAGGRVKEITPQRDTPWLDRGRPTTSSGGRFGKKRAGSAGRDIDVRPTTSNAEKKFKRIGRSLSRPRKALPMDTEIPPTPPAVEVKEDKFVPDLPNIPLNTPQERSHVRQALSQNGSIDRPSTANPTENLTGMHIFELPAEPLPLLPSTCYERPSPRPRSKSPVHESPSTNSQSFAQLGVSKNKALPPAPPPSAPLPPIPSETSSNQQLISPRSPSRNRINHNPTLRRSRSHGSRFDSKPSFVRSRSENNFALGIHPTMPSLVYDTDMTPESSIADSEASSVCSPIQEPNAFVTFGKRTPCTIDVKSARTHQYKDSGIGTPKTPITPFSMKRLTRTIWDTEDDEGIDVTGWTEADLREWDRSLGQFMEPISTDAHHDDAGLMRSLEANADKVRTMSSSSNEQALAQLHFGVLK